MNIFMVLCDELRADTLGFMGNDIINTPRIDELAQDSVIFENSFCSSPMCVPSRVSISTGRHAICHGAVDNLLKPLENEKSLFEFLKEQNYSTANFGKWHKNIEPKKFGVDVSNTCKEYLNAIESSISCFGIADSEVRKSTTYKKSPGDISLIISGTRPTHKDETLDTIVTKHYLKYLDSVKESGKPIFARLSILDPHTPYLPSEPFASMYDPESLPMPESMFDDQKNKPTLQNYFKKARGFESFNEADFRRSKAAYYGLVSHVDERIGLFVDYLKNNNLYDDSLIIFTSDHGSMLGEQGFVEKWGYMYDQVIRTPLLLKMPNNEGANTRKTSFVESIDILPTILNLLALEIPENIHGKSLLPYIRNKVSKHKDMVFAQYYCGSLQNTSALMVRDKKWKLTSYPEGHTLEEFLPEDHALRMSDFFDGEEFLGELYDLENDPEERCNLFNNLEYAEIKVKYLTEINDWVKSLGELVNTKTTELPNRLGSYIMMQGENMNKVSHQFSGEGKLSQLSKCGTKN